MAGYDRSKIVSNAQAGFRCPNCGKLLISQHTGDKYSLHFLCPRCKSKVTLECQKALPLLLDANKFTVNNLTNLINSLENDLNPNLIKGLKKILKEVESYLV